LGLGVVVVVVVVEGGLGLHRTPADSVLNLKAIQSFLSKFNIIFFCLFFFSTCHNHSDPSHQTYSPRNITKKQLFLIKSVKEKVHYKKDTFSHLCYFYDIKIVHETGNNYGPRQRLSPGCHASVPKCAINSVKKKLFLFQCLPAPPPCTF
jgi:hypothetical protein